MKAKAKLLYENGNFDATKRDTFNVVLWRVKFERRVFFIEEKYAVIEPKLNSVFASPCKMNISTRNIEVSNSGDAINETVSMYKILIKDYEDNYG